MPDATDDAGYASNWHGKLFAAFRRSVDPAGPEDATTDATTDAGTEAPTTIESAREALAAALLTAIQSVSNAHDRDDITRWLANAGETLSAEVPVTTKATELYKSIDSRRFAGIVVNTVRTSLNNYTGSSLPLAIKVALPVTLAGLPFLGLQGAGLVAFGGGVGLPVILLLFLGSAGVASIVEALEAVSKLSKGDHQAGDLQKGQEHLGLALIPNDEPAEVSEPRHGPFDGPAATITAE